MDVVDAEQAKVAEDAGAVAVMALERVPSDIRRDGGVARMSDPALIEGIKAAVTLPVMAKSRIGHFAEAQVLESLGVDYVDESEVLTPADEAHHVDKWSFTVPFVCGATNLGEALRRISEGAAMIRSKGEAGTGNIVEAVRHLRSILGDIKKLTVAPPEELYGWAKELRAPVVVTAIHPKTAFLEQIDRKELPPDFVRDIERWKSRSGVVKINLALSGLPEFTVCRAAGSNPWDSTTGPASPGNHRRAQPTARRESDTGFDRSGSGGGRDFVRGHARLRY